MSITRVTHFKLRSWRGPLALAALMSLLTMAGPNVIQVLRYDRTAVLAGEAWRLVTAHLVHHDLTHLAWNLAGLALVAWLFAAEFNTRQWLLILAASTAAIDVGFLVLLPQLEWYVGFSGVLHGAMAAGLLAWLTRTRDRLTWFVAAVFAAKLGWEHVAGPLPFTAVTLDLPVIYQAHSYGALGGLLMTAALEWRRRSMITPV
jgi:rhomboid family GlyGly-CTERM serine protease